MPIGGLSPFHSSFPHPVLFHFQEGQGIRNGSPRDEPTSSCPSPSSVPWYSLLGSSPQPMHSAPFLPYAGSKGQGAVLGLKHQRTPIRVTLHPISRFPSVARLDEYIPRSNRLVSKNNRPVSQMVITL